MCVCAGGCGHARHVLRYVCVAGIACVCVSGCGCVCVWIVRGCMRQGCGQFPGTPHFSHACICG